MQPEHTRMQLYERLHTCLKSTLICRNKEQQAYNWNLHARPAQRMPQGNWHTWLIMAGRGFGKTRTGAETIRSWVKERRAKNICLLGNTIADVRHVMVEGISGLLSVCPKEERPVFYASRGFLAWPSGAKAMCFSASAPEKLRGPQFDVAWVDELAKFQKARAVWRQLMLALRLSERPRCIITTTPRPIPLLRNLIKQKNVVVTKGKTAENTALSDTFLEHIQSLYQGTSFAAQELEGEICEDSKEALFTRCMLDGARLEKGADVPDFYRCVIAVDPAVTSNEHSSETGIIVAGTCAKGNAYIVDDLSGVYPPDVWAKKTIEAYKAHQADGIIAEVNNGGDLVKQTIHSIDKTVIVKSVRATRGKWMRAIPIQALYSQGRVFHTKIFTELEKQMLTYTPQQTKSPDRLDALVWALFALCLISQNNSQPQMWDTW